MNRRDFMILPVVSAAAAACGHSDAMAQTRLQMQAGQKVMLPAGDYLVDSTLPLGSIEGVGTATRLICGPGVGNLFQGTGDLRLANLSLVGNGRGSSYASGMAALVFDGSVTLDGVWLENFGGNGWIYAVRSVLTARNVSALSRTGNAIDGANATQLAHVFLVSDGEATISDSGGDCAFIKGFAAVIGASALRIERCTIRNSGTSNEISDAAAAYAILAYAEGDTLPSQVIVDHCTIDGARSCGVYVNHAVYVEVTHSSFASVTDQHDEIEARGAIALNQVQGFRAVGNTFKDCFVNIAAGWPTGRYRIL